MGSFICASPRYHERKHLQAPSPSGRWREKLFLTGLKIDLALYCGDVIYSRHAIIGCSIGPIGMTGHNRQYVAHLIPPVPRWQGFLAMISWASLGRWRANDA